MANRPKSISIHELSGAVNKALEAAKIKPTLENGPWPYINPAVLIGLIYVGPVAEARNIAASIAKNVSEQIGSQVAPVVEEGGVGTGAAVAKLALPQHVVLGYRHENLIHF